MNRILLTATFLTATAAFAADNNFQKTLSTGNSPTVSVVTGSGYVHLGPGSDNQVHIAAHLHINSGGWFNGSSSDAQSRIDRIVANPPIVQNGNEITIGDHHSNDLYRNITIDYEVTLPRASTIAASTGSGDVEVQDVGTSLKAQSGSGSVRARGIQGPATLGTGSGDIELNETGKGDIKAETGSGSIRLHGVANALKASTGSGDIEADGQPTSDWRISTGSGSVRLNVGTGAKFNLDADTGSGSVHVEQPITMQGNLNRHHISGAVNGGGPLIHANTGSGDIRIR